MGKTSPRVLLLPVDWYGDLKMRRAGEQSGDLCSSGAGEPFANGEAEGEAFSNQSVAVCIQTDDYHCDLQVSTLM